MYCQATRPDRLPREIAQARASARKLASSMRKQLRQRLDVLAMDLDELQSCDLAVHGLDQRALAHAARAPKQRVVGGKPGRKPRRIGNQRGARGVDALQQGKRHTVDGFDREKGLGLGLPDKGVARLEVGPLRPGVPSRSMARAIRSKRPERGS